MTMAGKKPNPFQMLLFMYTADVILVDMPFGLGGFANFFIGTSTSSQANDECQLLTISNLFWDVGFLVGQCLLGYKPGYEVFDK